MHRCVLMALAGALVLEATAANLSGSWRFVGDPELGVGAAYIGQGGEGYLELTCDVSGDGLDLLVSRSFYGRPLPGEDQVQLILIVPGKGTYTLPFRPGARTLTATLGKDHPLVEDIRGGSRLELRTATGEEVGLTSLSGSSRTISRLLAFCRREPED